VFVRGGTEIRHAWATELLFAPGAEGEETRHVDSIWPIWSVLDMTPQGRGSQPNFPGTGDGARGTRTPDLLGAIQALSQLSYSPRRNAMARAFRIARIPADLPI
jgi:hypothetical protein